MLRSRIVHIVRKVPWQAERRFASQAFRGQKLDSRILFGAAAFVGGNALWFGMRSPALAEAKHGSLFGDEQSGVRLAFAVRYRTLIQASYENRIKAFRSAAIAVYARAAWRPALTWLVTVSQFAREGVPDVCGDTPHLVLHILHGTPGPNMRCSASSRCPTTVEIGIADENPHSLKLPLFSGAFHQPWL
eukprot:3662804-Rhodomonas_salina.3